LSQEAHLKSKNHYADCEDLDAGGVIPNAFISTGEYPCNAYEIVAKFLLMRDPDTKDDWLLVKPKLNSLKWDIAGAQAPRAKQFNLHCPTTIIVFSKSKAGHNTIGNMCPQLSLALGIGRCTNAQVHKFPWNAPQMFSLMFNN
jgi:hypothetical protein